jgi:hypothetical protein
MSPCASGISHRFFLRGIVVAHQDRVDRQLVTLIAVLVLSSPAAISSTSASVR